MADTEEWLRPGERNHYTTKPHVSSLVSPIIVGIIVAVILGYLGYMHPAQYLHASAEVLRRHKTHGIILESIGGVFLVLTVLWSLSRWLGTRYFVTDQRVVKRHSLVTKNWREIPLNNIQSLSVQQGIVNRLTNTGTVILYSAAIIPLRIKAVKNPREVLAVVTGGKTFAPASVKVPRTAPVTVPPPTTVSPPAPVSPFAPPAAVSNFAASPAAPGSVPSAETSPLTPQHTTSPYASVGSGKQLAAAESSESPSSPQPSATESSTPHTETRDSSQTAQGGAASNSPYAPPTSKRLATEGGAHSAPESSNPTTTGAITPAVAQPSPTVNAGPIVTQPIKPAPPGSPGIPPPPPPPSSSPSNPGAEKPDAPPIPPWLREGSEAPPLNF